jgi:hypothetical protein
MKSEHDREREIKLLQKAIDELTKTLATERELHAAALQILERHHKKQLDNIRQTRSY